jgi:hypothetical protein
MTSSTRIGVVPGLPLYPGGITATSRRTVPWGTFGGMVSVSSGPPDALFDESAPAPEPAAENACGCEVATASGVGATVEEYS